ncbi:tRNA dihydrouridine synthase B [Lentilactobacillus kosonis]|uniref:tRNA dihydrouridine synthase B n=1 Tax=Lentilactobacillus kosonis TaxID=2810561 RepID=A0A401FP52_9LACO|nr:tRNA dihydrouridine synthase B [Lentilactobacillus kosonis]
MIDYVGADAAMMGRAVEGNPWILRQTEHYLATGELLPEPTAEQKIQTAKEHLHRLVELKGDYAGSHEFRGQSGYYLKGISHSARTKVALNNADGEEAMDAIFDEFLEKNAKRNSQHQEIVQ